MIYRHNHPYLQYVGIDNLTFALSKRRWLMFRCDLSNNGNSFTVIIEGCPSSGIEAVDFRRKHGLLEEASDKIEMSAYSWTDEEFVRLAPKNRVSSSADLEGRYSAGDQCIHICNAIGEVYQTRHSLSTDRWSG